MTRRGGAPSSAPALTPSAAPSSISQRQCRARRSLRRLPRLARFLQDHNVGVTDCVAFTCGNDLASAIVLLALLVGDWNFILLPPTAPPGGQNVESDVPGTFCAITYTWVSATPLPARSWPAWLGWRSPIRKTHAGKQICRPDRRVSLCRRQGVRDARTRAAPARPVVAGSRKLRPKVGLMPADRIALPVPIAHMFGLGAAFVPAILAGASIDIQPNANVLRFFARERQFGPTVVFMIELWRRHCAGPQGAKAVSPDCDGG